MHIKIAVFNTTNLAQPVKITAPMKTHHELKPRLLCPSAHDGERDQKLQRRVHIPNLPITFKGTVIVVGRDLYLSRRGFGYSVIF